jgi:mannose-6-phosphate isomerase-like protein (cupin superfamily)
MTASIEHRLRTIKADWASRGYSFEYWIDPPGQSWRDFVHQVDELVMLIEGEIELVVDGKTLQPAVGEEVLIPARARHTVTNTGSISNRWCFGYREEVIARSDERK